MISRPRGTPAPPPNDQSSRGSPRPAPRSSEVISQDLVTLHVPSANHRPLSPSQPVPPPPQPTKSSRKKIRRDLTKAAKNGDTSALHQQIGLWRQLCRTKPRGWGESLTLAWDSAIEHLFPGYSANPLSHALHVAVVHGHADAVSVLLQTRIDPNKCSSEGRLPLLTVAQKNNVNIAKILLEYGANPLEHDIHSEDRPLEVALCNNRLDMIALFLESNIDVNQLNAMNGLVPLAFTRSADALHQMVVANADPNKLDKGKNTPLYHAAAWRHPIVVALLQARANPNAGQNSPTMQSLMSYRRSERNEDYLATFVIPLLRARGNIAPFITHPQKKMLALALKTMTRQMYTKHLLASLNWLPTDLLRELQGFFPVERSVPGTDAAKGPDLWEAVQDGNVAKLEELLCNGADPNISDEKAQTPLYMAVIWGDVPTIHRLLAWGADPDGLKSKRPLEVALTQQVADDQRAKHAKNCVLPLLMAGASLTTFSHAPSCPWDSLLEFLGSRTIRENLDAAIHVLTTEPEP